MILVFGGHTMNMKKNFIIFILVIAMVMSLNTQVLADTLDNDSGVSTDIFKDAGDIAEHVEEMIGLDDVNIDIEEDGDIYSAEGELSDIEIPVDGDEEIVMISDGFEPIAIGIPEEMQDYVGECEGNGTIIYSEDGADASLAVQATKEEQDELIIEGVKSLVTIENSDAPKSYTFSYNLPANHSLIKSEEYNEEGEKGWIYIVNNDSILIDEETGEEHSEIVSVIEPAWAKDMNGNEIETFYDIKGNDLIQTILFNKNSLFPIVADPKTTTKPKSRLKYTDEATCNINHSYIGLGSFVSGSVSKGLTSAAKSKIRNAIIAKLGSKFIPIVGVASWAMVGYASIQSARGYNYTKVYIKYEVWSVYKHQGGRWVQGSQYRNVKMKLTLVK